MIDIKNDIVFVTTSCLTKWLNYQTKIIKKFFPDTKHLIFNGQQNWPYPWFYWINEIKKSDSKYFIHIDEDFFITDRDEFLKVIEKMEDEEIDLMGPPDGYHHYRSANPVAMNSFLMYGRVDKVKQINLNGIQFAFNQEGWINNLGLKYKEEYSKDFNYRFTKNGGSNFEFQQEPYYAFMWAMKEAGCKFDYLYPHFDERFKSTNPRIEEDSPDIGIHMWYVRQWNSNMDVWGLPNIERYQKIENLLNELHNN